MLGQGYDFPPICVVVPLRPYGSFSEFYQFIGRGIRVMHHPALTGRVGPEQQFLDIVYHAELGLDDHIDTIYAENDMDPLTGTAADEADDRSARARRESPAVDETGRLETFVLFERGDLSSASSTTRREWSSAAQNARTRRSRALRRVRRRAPEPVSFEQYMTCCERSVTDNPAGDLAPRARRNHRHRYLPRRGSCR